MVVVVVVAVAVVVVVHGRDGTVSLTLTFLATPLIQTIYRFPQEFAWDSRQTGDLPISGSKNMDLTKI